VVLYAVWSCRPRLHVVRLLVPSIFGLTPDAF
jgi:hypothetical protein